MKPSVPPIICARCRHLALKTMAILPMSLAGAVTLWVGTRCALAVGIGSSCAFLGARDAPYKKFGIGIPTKSLALVSWYHCCHRDKGQGSGCQGRLQGLAQDKVQAAMPKRKYGAMRQEDTTI
uniref:Uncharacterized protein n=1 Tax=Micrurus paraensis TaxID=1970185 RepID=A0A2D4K9N8_9SAUR